MRRIQFIWLILPSIFIISCDNSGQNKSLESNQTLNTENPMPEPSTPPPASSPNEGALSDKVCYLSRCLDTVPIAKIQENKEDYKYPSSSDFPDENKQKLYLAPIAILDLKNLDPSLKLTQHFRVGELMSVQKGRYGLFSSNVLTIIEGMRKKLGRSIQINSAYRSPGYNKSVDGSAKWSRHTYGDAVDIKIAGLSIQAAKTACSNHKASFTLTYKTHVHCDWRQTKKDPSYYGESELTLSDLPDLEKIEESASSIELIDLQTNFLMRAQLPEELIEEGELTYTWSITSPRGDKINSMNSEVLLPKEPGKFTINVIIGDAIKLSKVVEW